MLYTTFIKISNEVVFITVSDQIQLALLIKKTHLLSFSKKKVSIYDLSVVEDPELEKHF